MFKRILVANRGEIACRIQKTCRRLGIETVAVGSAVDENALHMQMAHRAVVIGPAEARESCLNGAVILQVALQEGADAIHPGYGFLSENPDFAEKVREAGLVFIGPSTKAIQAMGSKVNAKAIARSVNVPVIPGYEGEGNLMSAACQTGFPLLIKATYGGGGKGMRRVDAASEFEAALAACQREAKAAFGNSQVMLEKCLVRPRHVEVQVLGDRYGKCIALSDRDCSLQRRHQKVVEEAPAPDLSEDLRQSLHKAAVAIAQAVGYEGAGTVEFLVEEQGAFFFLEMNTRLQVEHPVTEMVLGIDLVEWQLRLAAGEPLLLDQDGQRPRGHSVEARLYAEDGERHFLPSTGTITRFDVPGGENIRVDTGIRVGDAMTIHYDPMIAKIIHWGESREAALTGLTQALLNTHVEGVKTNLHFLRGLLAHADMRKTAPDIDFINRHIGQGGSSALKERVNLSVNPWAQQDGWRLNAPAIPYASCDEGITAGDRVYSLKCASADSQGKRISSAGCLTAPMPGRVVSVMVAVDDAVEAGQSLLILEAMKMEHTIRSPHAGIVEDVPFSPGDFCEEGVELVRLKELH